MNAFSRLSRFGGTVKERALPIWTSALVQFQRSRQWLRLRPQAVFFAAGMGIVALLLLIFSGVTAAVAAVAAWIALMRHFAQTEADRQRRITESFSKAVEQLGSDKLEVRLGGIYSLERISKESADDYWTVMENLTAFVRERSRRNEAERTSQDLEQRVSRRAYFLWLEAGKPDGWAENLWAEAAKLERRGAPPAADIAAVLTVIKRRSKQSQEHESTNKLCLDLNGSVLKLASLFRVQLEWAGLNEAHLERAGLGWANLRRASLVRAHLEGADLTGADLTGARLSRTDLSQAYLIGADLSHADLTGADLKGAHLERADLTGADLTGASVEQLQLDLACGADATLPAGLTLKPCPEPK